MISEYYYSLETILQCKNIRLVRSHIKLVREDIPEYTLGDEIFSYIREPQKIFWEEKKFVFDFSDAEIKAGYLNFNYILYVAEDNDSILGFVKLDEEITGDKFYIRRINVIFINDTEDLGNKEVEISLDYSTHEKNTSKVHKYLQQIAHKRDIDEFPMRDNPFFSNYLNKYKVDIANFKYSGRLVTGDRTFIGNAFQIPSGYTVKGFINYKGAQALVTYRGSTVKLVFEDDSIIDLNIGGSLIEISDDFFLCNSSNGKFDIYYLNDNINTRRRTVNLPTFTTIDNIHKYLLYIKDDISREIYFYRYLTNSNTIDPTDNELDFDRSSTKFKELFESVYSGKKLKAEIKNITTGLIVYDIDDYTVLSYPMKPLNENTEKLDNLDQYVQLIPKLNSKTLVSNKLLFGQRGSNWYIYELQLINERYEWVRLDLGTTRFLKNIFYLGKCTWTNPFIELTTYTYDGICYHRKLINGSYYLVSV
jgi:hypothetical protein